MRELTLAKQVYKHLLRDEIAHRGFAREVGHNSRPAVRKDQRLPKQENRY
jgi:hypothetical protein